jgi:hypothetical protein
VRADPVAFLIDYLKTCKNLPPDAVPTGTLIGRNPGDLSIYLYHSGGHRIMRDKMDRADIWYDAYNADRASAAGLAYLTREYLLEDLPGKLIDGVQILDVKEISSPKFVPDNASNEDAYGGEVAIFFTES